MHTNVEREAKYRIEPGAVGPDLTRLPEGLTAVALPDVRLSARYWDTPGLDLLRRGITLRHRRGVHPGDEDLWTLKLPDADATGVYTRTELSWPGVARTVPAQAKWLLRATTTGVGPLDAVATLVTVRRRHEVRDSRGRRLAEVDDDRVTVTAPTGMVFRQIEVELGPDGDDELISRLAKLLRRAGAHRSPDTPKLSLALGQQPVPAPRTGPKPGKRGDGGSDSTTIGEALRASLAQGLDRIVAQDIALRLEVTTDGLSDVAAPARVEGAHSDVVDSVEVVHKARVACRRLRSDLDTFAPVLDETRVRHLSDELRWWGATLGAVRDLDVLADRVSHYAGDADPADQRGFAALTARISGRRRTAWEQVVTALDGDRYLDLLRELESAAAEPPLGQDAGLHPATSGPGVRRLVRRPWRRLRKAVRALPADPTDAQLHRVRIRAKQLRYASEAVTGVVGRPARRTAKAAAGLQSVLGAQHDAVVAEAALRSIAGSLSRRGALAAGLGIAAEQRRQHNERVAWGVAWDRLGGGHPPRWLRA